MHVDHAIAGHCETVEEGIGLVAGVRAADETMVGGALLRCAIEHFLSPRQRRMKAGNPDTPVREQYGCR